MLWTSDVVKDPWFPLVKDPSGSMSSYHQVDLRDPAAGAARGLAAASGHQGVSLIGLGKPGQLRVDQPTITGELGPAPDAYTHYSPVMIAALPKTAGRSAFDEGGPFFLRQERPGPER